MALSKVFGRGTPKHIRMSRPSHLTAVCSSAVSTSSPITESWRLWSKSCAFARMVVVAVAGGTGAVGRNIVEALISQGKHEVIILSRTVCHSWSSNPLPSWLAQRRTPLNKKKLVLASSPQITKTWRHSPKSLRTTMSILLSLPWPWCPTRLGRWSRTLSRLPMLPKQPRDWYLANSGSLIATSRYRAHPYCSPQWLACYFDRDGDLFPSTPMKQASQRALEASSLEWTIVYNGYFIDYFGMPKLTSYLAPKYYIYNKKNLIITLFL